ncbi:hypothetical protein CA54_36100 [Symmachiella macrocystis]|uniref:HTH HARE-type domain-containing protein n=1 Tax=Symmachiella macrocystis TaxID=2527985 RepID=A0A5C6BTD9_9PLAN|nr:winged helix-turn-helix domain-containing protein [Symmachiella macrocystis]TWU14741.1 hypothetical protein CA54_36100 [Symmachiella macrocystis]
MAAKKTTRKTTTAKKEKLSQIQTAIRVLEKSKEPLNCQAMVEQMAKQRLWKSPGGKTPAATLYAAILRDIQKQGKHARFKKVDRGLFTLNR